jgi:hypothetical protein
MNLIKWEDGVPAVNSILRADAVDGGDAVFPPFQIKF